MTSKSLKPILLSVGVITMSLAVNFAFAWTEPAGAPPSGNVSAPVNVSSTGQTKAGALTVQGNLTAPIFYDGNDSNYYVNPAGESNLYSLKVKDSIKFLNIYDSVFIGYKSGNAYTDLGGGSTGLGAYSLYSATYSVGNTAVGRSALYSNNSAGEWNTAVGTYALNSNTSADYNTANGAYSLFGNTTGYNNTAIGYKSLYSNTTGYENTAIGYQALYSNIDSGNNTAIGRGSLYSATYGGNNNTAIGFNSLFYNTGTDNTATGLQSLYKNTAGVSNTATGRDSLWSNTTGNNNTALGYSSLYSNVTGSGNVALGYYAGRYETGSNSFYVDNQDRTNTAGDKSKALMYGTFAAATSSQQLTVNGALNVTGTLTVGGSPVGGGTNYWTQSGTTLRPTTTSWQLLFGSTATSANYPYAAMIGSKGIAGSATGALIGIAGEALSDNTKNATGILGIGKGYGSYSGRGIEGAGYVNASADTATAFGGYFYADSTHSGGMNIGLRGYANYSSYENYGVYGIATTPSTGATYVTIGTYGQGTTYGATSAVGVYGKALVAATGDTAGAYGGIFYANTTHAGGPNYGVYSDASGGASNYSFYGNNGVLFNWGNVGIGMGRSAPLYALDVIRAAPNVARFTSTGTGASPDVLIVDQDNDNTRAALQIQGNGGSSEVLFVSSGGNIGVGTITPGSKLEIKQSSALEIPLIIDSYGTDKNAYTQYQVGNSGGWEHGMSGSGDSYKYFFSYGAFGATNAKLTLQSNGSVGIGTVAPTNGAKLHILQGAYNFDDLVVESALPSIRLADSETNQAGFGFLADGNNLYLDTYTYANRFANSYGTHIMTITSAGNVNITGSLTVNGSPVGGGSGGTKTGLTAGEVLSADAAAFILPSSGYLDRGTNIVTGYDLKFGTPSVNGWGDEKNAQGFLTIKKMSCSRISVFLKKTGAPTDNVRISLQTNSGGAPSGTMLWSTTKAGSSLTTSYIEYDFDFTALDLAANTQYWIVLERDSTLSDVNYYSVQAYVSPGTATPSGSFSSYIGKNSGYVWGYNMGNGGPCNYPFGVKIKLSGTAGRVYNASAYAAGDYGNALGFAVADAASGGTVSLEVDGMASVSVSAGSSYYLSNSYGEVSTGAGTNTKKIGIGFSSTEMLITNQW